MLDSKTVLLVTLTDEEIISGCSLAGFKRKLGRHLRDKGDIYISYSFLPRYRQFGWLGSADASSSSSRHTRPVSAATSIYRIFYPTVGNITTTLTNTKTNTNGNPEP